ncbi:hypothetical protein ACFL58_04515, partial [Elusimicrobiota bacterium]
MKKNFKFKSGIKLKSNKINYSYAVDVMPPPEKVVLSLISETGDRLEPVVEKGAKVLSGQKIADAQTRHSVP